MTVSIPLVFNIPIFAWHGTYIILIVLGIWGSRQLTIWRMNYLQETSVRKAANQQRDMPWWATGEAVVINRPSPDIAVFKVRRFAHPEPEGSPVRRAA